MIVGNPADRPRSGLQIASGADRSFSRRPDASKAPHPLTHHQILRLVEPFTRRGRHVDLAASNRIERQIVFKPIIHAGEATAIAGACEVLKLENPRPDVYRVVRTLTPEHGAMATIVTDGACPGELLARIEAIPPQRQFQLVSDVLVVRNYRLEPASGTRSAATRPTLLVLTSAEARLKNLTLVLKAETGKGYPAEIELLPGPGGHLDLPDDLLATLGWNWRVLRRRGAGWITTLRVPRREPDRSRHIEMMLERTVSHLERTLAEPPNRFHERLVRDRWLVVFRRTIPLLSCLLLIAGTAALTRANIPPDSMILMMIFNFPPILMLILFGMRELPRFEIPPLPRPSTSPSWLQPHADPDIATKPDVRPT